MRRRPCCARKGGRNVLNFSDPQEPVGLRSICCGDVPKSDRLRAQAFRTPESLAEFVAIASIRGGFKQS
jgi:hypothetical protein